MLLLPSLIINGLLALSVNANPLAAIAAKRQNVSPGPVSGDTFIHDPSVVKTPGRSYIAAFTADGIGLKQSADRTTWRDVGAAFPNGASWTTAYTGGAKNLWAPDISYRNGQYYMYYSASSFGTSKSAIFLATSSTGLSNTWTNQGLIVETTATSGYNAIDPNLIVDASGKWWLTFGSFWTGIKIIELNSSTGKRSGSSLTSIAARPNNGGALEAPMMIRHGSYYYLWVSFDKCCLGASSTYRMMVGRSTKPNGPFVDKAGTDMMNGGGTQMMNTHGSVHGPGGCSIFTDTDADVLVYHYYKDNGDATLGINLIKYVDDWPVIY